MSSFLQALVNSEDSCGPVNPVSQLAKGLQGEGSQLGRDRFSALPGPSGPSSSFRSRNLQPAELEQDAAARAFFDQQRVQHAGSPYAMDGLQRSLPAGPSHVGSVPAWATDFMQHTSTHPGQPGMSERAWEKSRMVDQGPAVPAWAADFSKQHLQQESYPARVASPAQVQQQQQRTYAPMPMMMQNNLHNSMAYGPKLGMMQHHGPPILQDTGYQDAGAKIQEIDASQASTWESAFVQHLQQSSPDLLSGQLSANSTLADNLHNSFAARSASPGQTATGNDNDLLSRTAGELLQNINHDLQSNDKMRNSSFMRLMQKLRDKEIKVQGDKMVEQVDVSSEEMAPGMANIHVGDIDIPFRPTTSIPMESKISGAEPVCVWPQSAREAMANPQMANHSGNLAPSVDDLSAAYAEMNASLDSDLQAREARAQRAFHGDGGGMMFNDEEDQAMLDIQAGQNMLADSAVRGATQAWEEDFDFDNALLRSGPEPPTMEQMLHTNAQQAQWSDMQDQWDAFETTSAGIQAANPSVLANYPFHTRNPYLLNTQHRNHLPANTLLEKEADVQQHPMSPQAWLNLGLKQQENEREALAIQALQRALELDDNLKEAWMALAVSYTNENIRGKAYDAIDRWMDCSTEYSSVVSAYKQKVGQSEASMLLSQRHVYLTNLLVEMARAGAGENHNVDPDVQIALGVMFNASEEYEKACDCFSAALSIRPSDPHLFNRLGATMANSGKPETAIEYYYRALELQPDFARATFNLAIACMNLNAYSDAAEHVLRALAMQQDSDEDVGEPSLQHLTEEEQVQSSLQLWDTLATCCNSLGRSDLAEACAKRTLAPFKAEFVF